MLEFLKYPLNRLRAIGIIEGISYLALFFISMPLKYYLGIKGVNIFVGYSHGILFIIYVIIAIENLLRRNISLLKFLWIFIAALIPFATFFNEPMLKKYQRKIVNN